MALLIVIIEAVPFWKAAIYMVLGSIILFAVMGAGSYILIRFIAHYLNSRRDSWAHTASSLGLTPDQSKGVMLKTLTGKRGEHIVTVEPFAVQTGKYTSDAYAAVEVQFRDPLDFSLKISKPEMLYQKVASFFDTNETEIGFDVFDKAFDIQCSHSETLKKLLHLEMLNGQSPTLLTDLMLANKRYHRVIVTDRAVCLGVRADPEDAVAVEATIVKAIYLADRIAEANRRINESA
jgi:hypothetical protein